MKRIRKFLVSLLLTYAMLVLSVIAVPQMLPAVTVEAATVKLSKSSLNLTVGCSYTLKVTGTAKKVSWSSSKSSVAAVSSKGKVTAKKEGTAKITAKVGGKKYTCKVTVKGNYKKLYKNFLKKGKVTYKSGSYTYTDKIGSFCLLDIDKNGVPELIAKNSAAKDTFSTHYIYTVKSGKIVYCGNYYVKGDSKFYYNSKYKAIYTWWWTNGVGGVGGQLLRISNSKLASYKYAWEGYKSPGSSKRVYYTGTSAAKSKLVSKSTYTSYVKKYLKGQKAYSFLTNNDKNRTAKFGK